MNQKTLDTLKVIVRVVIILLVTAFLLTWNGHFYSDGSRQHVCQQTIEGKIVCWDEPPGN